MINKNIPFIFLQCRAEEKRHDVVTVVQDNKKLVAEKQFLFALAVIICLLLIVGYQLRDRKRRLEINRQQQFLEEEKNRHEKQETEQEGRLRELTAEMVLVQMPFGTSQTL